MKEANDNISLRQREGSSDILQKIPVNESVLFSCTCSLLLNMKKRCLAA